MRYFWLLLYYGLAKHLPKSNVPVFGKMENGYVHYVLSTYLQNVASNSTSNKELILAMAKVSLWEIL